MICFEKFLLEAIGYFRNDTPHRCLTLSLICYCAFGVSPMYMLGKDACEDTTQGETQYIYFLFHIFSKAFFPRFEKKNLLQPFLITGFSYLSFSKKKFTGLLQNPFDLNKVYFNYIFSVLFLWDQLKKKIYQNFNKKPPMVEISWFCLI